MKSTKSLTLPFHRIVCLLLAAAVMLATVSEATAATKYFWWDTSTTTGLQAGNGTWNSSNLRWSNASGGSATLYPWSLGSTGSHAYFNATEGTSTIDVSDTQDVNTITFGGSGYTLTGGAIKLAGTGGTAVNITATKDATIASVIEGAELTKAGAGKLTLRGANTYGSDTTIRVGVLNIQNNRALGSTDNGTIVMNNAALELEAGSQGAVTTGAENLALNGTGVASAGALRNIVGNNTYGGYITIASNARINSDSGTLLISNAGGMRTNDKSITFGGAGDITVSNGIAGGTGSGALIKDGTGTLTLGGKNMYTGTTTVSGGTLVVTDSLTNNGSLVNNGSDMVFIAKDADGAFGVKDDVILSRRVAAGGSYGGLGSAVQGASLSTIANIREGTNTALGVKDVVMQWRERTATESASHRLVSEVLNLSGMANPGTSAGPFVLEMSYDPTQLRPGQTEEQYRQSGAIHVAWLDGSVWKNAVAGNIASGSSVVTNFNGSWDTFYGSHTNDWSSYLGSWGVDTTGAVHKAWAIIDHNSSFAVVPEPGVLALLVCGVLCWSSYVRWLRK